MCRVWLAENAGHKKSPSAHHHTTLSRYIFATKACIDNQKKIVKWQYLLHMSSQYAELRPINDWDLLASFNGFRVLASLLHRRHSTDVNQTLHDVWPSPALVHYTYIFGASCPLTEFCPLQNSLCVQILRCPILAALMHSTQALGISQTLWRSAESATYIQKGGHHVGHWPTF